MKFNEIVKAAKKDAHKIYGLNVNGKTVFHSPRKSAVNPVAELNQKRNAEREERAKRLENLVDTAMRMAEQRGLGELELLENENVCIAGMLNPPEHITLADNKLAIRFTGLR